MSRLRRSIIELNSLSENDYLEQSEQEQLITLLSDISYTQNNKLIRIFVLMFFSLNPIYLISPTFKKSIIGLLCLLLVNMSCINMLWFNQYAILKDELVSKTLGDNTFFSNVVNSEHVHTNLSRTGESKDTNRISLKIKNRLAAHKSNKLVNFTKKINTGSEMFRKILSRNQLYHMLFQISLILASTILVAFQYHKGLVLHFNGDSLLIFLPLFTSITSVVINHWIKDLVNNISDLKKYKYHGKNL